MIRFFHQQANSGTGKGEGNREGGERGGVVVPGRSCDTFLSSTDSATR